MFMLPIRDFKWYDSLTWSDITSYIIKNFELSQPHQSRTTNRKRFWREDHPVIAGWKQFCAGSTISHNLFSHYRSTFNPAIKVNSQSLHRTIRGALYPFNFVLRFVIGLRSNNNQPRIKWWMYCVPISDHRITYVFLIHQWVFNDHQIWGPLSNRI